MERHELLALMLELHLAGMRAVFDEVLRDAIRRERSFQDLLGDLLKAELAQKQARSISYQIGATHLPVAKELTDFVFAKSPVNETLVRDLQGGSFLETKRNVVLIGGTGSGKTHLAIAMTANCVRKGARARFFTAVDLVNQSRPGKFGQRAKWKICLKAVKMPRIRRRDDKTDTQKSRAGL
jgi:DNA replication protein DnaC